ncbi:MAG: peptidase, partial [Nevskia sp.]|nr:peptidase [Nevskia sp.]
LCSAYAAQYPQAVRCIEFGRTPEGRAMLALVASTSNALTPAAVHMQNKPVLLVQGGIHSGEIDGKDAGFLVLRELLDQKIAAGALDHFTLLFVPVFNIDGHERFGRWNRPNQVGPEEMGWRTTAQNLNLNRDYMKADAPEMQAMLRLINDWDPILQVDLHVTDGAKFQHDVSIQLEPAYSGDPELRKAGLALRSALAAKLARQGSLPLTFYPSFVVNDDPSSGFEDLPPQPRFSSGYPALRNRFGMLVETHSWKDYATRVRVTHNTLVDLFEQTAQHGAEWLDTAHAADALASQLAGTTLPLDYQTSERARTVDFLGYAYTRTPSAISGALMTRYDDTRPQVWHLPLRDEVQTKLSATVPAGGYIVPAAQAAWMADKLALHGIRFERIEQAQAQRAVETFRAAKVVFAPQSFEGHSGVTLSGQWAPEPRDIPAGSLFVPIAQPKARLLMALLEPQAPDSYAAWGFFNNAFEQKEYMENYVAEDVARDLLAKDPKLAVEFEAKLAADAEFQKDPQARLDFFYRRSPSYDERLNLYPVMRVGR